MKDKERRSSEVPLRYQRLGSAHRWLVPEILAAAAAVFLAVVPMAGAEARMNHVSDTLIEITGGTGARAWRLRYGTPRAYPDIPVQSHFVTTEGNRAWFSHRGWLRLIDTEKGMVIGRWHFPGEITRVVPVGTKVQIEVEDYGGEEQERVRRTFTFDPSAPAVPYWPNGALYLYRLPAMEAESGWPLAYPGEGVKVSAEQGRELIPELEDAVRRDPAAPWIRFTLGKVLLDIGDPRARAVFQEAIQGPPADFTELIPISAELDDLGERELAGAAFERGYQDFFERGNDPRLFTILLGRLILYARPHVRKIDVNTLSDERRRELIERIYKLQPYGEAADLAWQLYADYLQKTGQAEAARMWQARAKETKAGTLFPLGSALTLVPNRALIVILASFLATVAYIFVLYLRYRPQRRLAVAAEARTSGLARRFSLFTLEYWDRRQRIAFLTIALAGWLALGLAGAFAQVVLRLAEMPISTAMGSLAAPATEWFFKNRLAATPERDLLLAMAAHDRGETEKAERLYRSLPQFAESWNNLGVIWENAGRKSEARQAFERALAVNPNLAEAALNLGRPPQTLWTELHQKYLPGRPMMAPPQRDELERAFLGGSRSRLFLRAPAGHFAVPSYVEVVGFLGPEPMDFALRVIVSLFLVAVLLAIALVLVIPSKEVTQPPGGWHWLWELLFPGTSAEWHLFGGLILVAWSYFLVQILVLLWVGTPYIFTWMMTPSLAKAYLLPPGFSDPSRLINPSWIWVYVAPAVLFGANLALVRRSRRA
jgi:tetratricopeptide (TPR) repeat protein